MTATVRTTDMMSPATATIDILTGTIVAAAAIENIDDINNNDEFVC